ncbi:MAG: glycosyltransferase family 4 protein [Leptolyngbyaceae cyanobacterium]
MVENLQETDSLLISNAYPTPKTMQDLAHHKISLIVGDLSAKGAGRWGGAVRPFLLAKALKQLGLQVEILGFTDDELPLFIDPEITIKQFPYTTYPSFMRSGLQLIRAIEGDVVYAYKTKASSFGVGLLARKLKQRPLILDIDDWEMSWHSGEQWAYRASLKQRYRDLFKPDGALRQPDHPIYLKRMEQWVHHADAVTVHTNFLQKRFGGTCVPNGKDTVAFNPGKYDGLASRKKYGLNQYRVLMFPGAPRPYKGLEDILTALDILNQPDIKLVIVGGSPYDDYDDQLISQWGQHIVQIPKVPYDKMPEVISAADIIVVPQQDTAAAQAQFPLKLTDGMAMAKPILATCVGDIPEILGDTGYLVPAGDSQAMARQISEIFSKMPEALARGQEARIRCIHKYSIDAMAQVLSSLIYQLVASAKQTNLQLKQD